MTRTTATATICALLLAASPAQAGGQQRPAGAGEFTIGIFAPNHCATRVDSDGCRVPYTTPTAGGMPTSTLNTLADDGFSVVQNYMPSEWTSERFLHNYLLLARANGLKVHLGAGHYYKPASGGADPGHGTNVYDNCGADIGPCQSPYSRGYFRADIDQYIARVYTAHPYRDIIWGYHICEEASYRHPQHFAADCRGPAWGDSRYFVGAEMPPANVAHAMLHYKTSLAAAGVTGHRTVVMEAHHHKSIHDSTHDGKGVYNPQDYIRLLSPDDPRDIFLEGSYTKFPHASWQGQDYARTLADGYHYLGPFRSIDYARRHAAQAHKVVSTVAAVPPGGALYHYHSDTSRPNANWLWFQAYTAIIHGAQGVWFWALPETWTPGETNPWRDTADHARFQRPRFPALYRDYVANLARELRLLANRGILANGPAATLATKTDHACPLGIVPPAASYIPAGLPAEKRTENYGLRYTLRTNGAETYMVISNPLNTAVAATLDLSRAANPHIRAAAQAEVLFDDGRHTPASAAYKIDRHSGVDPAAGTVERSHRLAIGAGRRLTLALGPLDVKVLRFAPPPAPPANGWQRQWSNLGSGRIGGHQVRQGDTFLAGDFDGDGRDDILGCDLPDGWTTLFGWNGQGFAWRWSDYGENTTLRPYRHRLVPGDFDGDGRDELLGLAAWATLFRYRDGHWQWAWSSYGNSDIGGWPIPPGGADHIQAADMGQGPGQALLAIETADAGRRAATLSFASPTQGWRTTWTAAHNDPRLHDWPVSDPSGGPARYLAIRAQPNQPHQLLALRSFYGVYLVNLYRRESQPDTRPLQSQNARGGAIDATPHNTIRVFPNPSRGPITIESDGSPIISAELYTAAGELAHRHLGPPQNTITVSLPHPRPGVYLVVVRTPLRTTAARTTITP